jgi:hypothetical protein
MREIDLSLQENLLAEKVVMVADTCHSASIVGSGTASAGLNCRRLSAMAAAKH